MAKEHHTPEANRIFCSSLSDIYGAMHKGLVDQRVNYAEELGETFGENMGKACEMIIRFLQGEELSIKDTQKVSSILKSFLGNDQLNKRLQAIIFQERTGLSKAEILASLDQIKESKKFLEDFFLEQVRKEGTDENNLSEKNFETKFTSDHLISALRADMKLITPEIKLRMDMANKNQYDEVGPWHKDLAVYQKGGKYGIINKQGKELGEPQDEYIYIKFHDDYIRIGNKFYDHTMKLTHDLSNYLRVTDPSEGLIGARGWHEGGIHQDDLLPTHYIDQHTGEKVITLDPMINHIGQFKDGLAKVRYGKRTQYGPRGKFGYIDRTGKIVIPCKYDACSQNENGYMLVQRYPDVNRMSKYDLYIVHYKGKHYTEKLVDTWHDPYQIFDDGNRDNPGFVNGEFVFEHSHTTVDTQGNIEELTQKEIKMKSGRKVIVDFKTAIKPENHGRYNCTIIDKDGKKIAAPGGYRGIDNKNDLIFVGDGIVTSDGEYIGPLKERVLKKYFKAD